MDIVPIVFIIILVLVVIDRLVLLEHLSLWMVAGLPLYEKSYKIRTNQKLSTYIRVINEQDVYPPLDCKRKRPQEYLLISYVVTGRAQNVTPFTRGRLQYRPETGTLFYTGYLSVLWPLAILGLILVPPWLGVEVEIFPLLLGIGVFVALMIGTFWKHHSVNAVIKKAIEKTEKDAVTA